MGSGVQLLKTNYSLIDNNPLHLCCLPANQRLQATSILELIS